MFIIKPLTLLLLCITYVACSSLKAWQNNISVSINKAIQIYSNVNNFYNVIVQDGADPWVYKHTNGWYYFTRTTGGNVVIWRSRTLTGIDAGESKIVWSTKGGTAACRDVWAPEIHFIQNKWYIYFAARPCENDMHRMFVLENVNGDPFNGDFLEKGQITDWTNKWAIDGTVLQNTNGQLYFIWSGWEGDQNVRQILYIAHMSNPWTIDSARVEIARPVHAWETNHSPYINEGPQVIIRNNQINLVYSASGSWTNDYSLGIITAKTDSDLLNPYSWRKRDYPIFQSANGLFGPGHHSFTKSKDDRQDWIVYHTARFSGSGWTRNVRTQPFTWNTDDTPNLGAPHGPNTLLTLPSGEPNRDRYEAESASLTNGPYSRFEVTASNGHKVGHIDLDNSLVEFSVQTATSGWYIIIVRTGNGSNGNALASHYLTINHNDRREIFVVNSGWNNWGTSTTRLWLNAGRSILGFTKGLNYAEIDALDIFLDL